MKYLLTFIACFLCLNLFPQAEGSEAFQQMFRIQPMNGLIISRSNDPEIEDAGNLQENTMGTLAGVQASKLWPVRFLNMGGGIGVSVKHLQEYHGDEFCPRVFLMFEAGNVNKRQLLSAILLAGAERGFASGKSVFFFGGGPSFNFKSGFQRVNFSLNPYFEYSQEKKDDTWVGNSPAGYPIFRNYTLYYHHFSVNLSLIIQLNK